MTPFRSPPPPFRLPPTLDLSPIVLKDLKARLWDSMTTTTTIPGIRRSVATEWIVTIRVGGGSPTYWYDLRCDSISRICEADGIYIRNCWDERELPMITVRKRCSSPRSESRYIPRMARNPRKFRTREIARFYTPTFFFSLLSRRTNFSHSCPARNASSEIRLGLFCRIELSPSFSHNLLKSRRMYIKIFITQDYLFSHKWPKKKKNIVGKASEVFVKILFCWVNVRVIWRECN